MTYRLTPTTGFLQDLNSLSSEAKLLIRKKILLIMENPFRYKKLQFESFVFRLRFKDKGKELKLIYWVKKDRIILVCILDRKGDYKNLQKKLEKVEERCKSTT